jgi:predicted nucleic acid-binding protein
MRTGILNDRIADIAIYPVILGIALLAGRISGRQGRRRLAVPFEDLLIGATALHHQCDVVTENVGHFEMIPGLVVRRPQVAENGRNG